MPQCPKCHKRLVRSKFEKGYFFGCPSCKGRAVAVAVLRRTIPPAELKRLWLEACQRPEATGVECPCCGHPTNRVTVTVKQQPIELDLCKSCQFVWFDTREFEAMPRQAPPPGKKPISAKAREKIAMAEIERVAHQQRGDDFGTEPPDEPWKLLPAFFGLPVEQEVQGLARWPIVTWALSAVIVLVLALTWNNLDNIIQEWGLIPAQVWRHGGLTLVTSFFLHVGIVHVVGNVYFLLIFGDNVEDYLGRWRYVALLVSASLVGDMIHVLLDPRAMVPCVGASGGISGVITFYALSFPRARLGFMVRYWMVYHWLYVPAWTAMLAWFALQLLLGWHQLAGGGAVSAMAHLGGAATGLNAWLYWRKRY